MDIYDQILENLELERDLGTRTVEIDRALLVPPTVDPAVEDSRSPVPAAGRDGRILSVPSEVRDKSVFPCGAGARGDVGAEASASAPSGASTFPAAEAQAPSGAAPASVPEATAPSIASTSSVAETPASPSAACDMLFLSGRPLSAAGQEAMRKTFAAMKKIKADVTVRLNENVPARIIVLLGSDALKGRTAVAARPVRGRWMTVEGVPALPTFSPDYIFSHFQNGSPGMAAAKRDMWNDIKAALARL